MKQFRRLSLGYFVALAAAVLTTATVEAKANKGLIRAIRGTAQISQNGSAFKPARVGAAVGENTVIKTASESTVDIFLGENGPVVRVTPDTSMGIDKLDLETTGIEKVIETQLDLKNGRILGSVKKMAAASKYEVKTPVGVAGIRGTEYSINSRGEVSIVSGSAMVVYVIDGKIFDAMPVGANQTVNPPVNATGQPTVTQGTGPVGGEVITLLEGVTTRDDGTIVVTIDRGVVTDIDVDGSNVGLPPTGTTQPNPNTIQTEREEIASPSENTGT